MSKDQTWLQPGFHCVSANRSPCKSALRLMITVIIFKTSEKHPPVLAGAAAAGGCELDTLQTLLLLLAFTLSVPLGRCIPPGVFGFICSGGSYFRPVWRLRLLLLHPELWAPRITTGLRLMGTRQLLLAHVVHVQLGLPLVDGKITALFLTYRTGVANSLLENRFYLVEKEIVSPVFNPLGEKSFWSAPNQNQ